MKLQAACNLDGGSNKPDLDHLNRMLEEMEVIVMESTKQVNGNKFVWTAQVGICVSMHNEGMQREALDKLKELLTRQRAYFCGNEHMSLEVTLNQLYRLSLLAQNYKEATEYLS
jgi:hypothetical protein